MAEALKEILEEIKSLEPLPEVALRVLELGAREDVVPADLVAVIQSDAGTTAKVLKLCNSAYYGFQREIASLQEAGNMLGVQTLVNLSLTACSGRYFRRYGTSTRNSSKALWEQSVVNALAASILARLRGEVDKNRAYTVGLLQNVGHLVLDRFMVDVGQEIEDRVAIGRERLAAEEDVLGIHHAEIGARLAERWNLPDVLVDSIRHHHHPEDATCDSLLTSIAHLAEVVTQTYEMGEGLEPVAYGLNESALGLSGLDQKAFDAMETTLTRELEKAREFVGSVAA